MLAFGPLADDPLASPPDVETISGTASSTLDLIGSATASTDIIEEGSLLGEGPIAAGAIGETQTFVTFAAGPSLVASGTFAIIGTATAGVLGSASASGTIALTGASVGRVEIRGYAPDNLSGNWLIEAADAGANIVNYPTIPETPEWSVSVTGAQVIIAEYPASFLLAPTVPFFDIRGSATAKALVVLAASGSFDIDGDASGSAAIPASASGILDFTGDAAGVVSFGGQASGVFPITGTGRITIGAFPVICNAVGILDLTGTSTIAVRIGCTATGNIPIFGVSGGVVIIRGNASGSFDVTAPPPTPPTVSSRRYAFPNFAENGGIVAPSERSGYLVRS